MVAYMNEYCSARLNSRIELRRSISISDGDQGLHSSLTRTRNDLLAVGVKLLAIEMRVRIDKHQKSDLRLLPPPSSAPHCHPERSEGSVHSCCSKDCTDP